MHRKDAVEVVTTGLRADSIDKVAHVPRSGHAENLAIALRRDDPCDDLGGREARRGSRTAEENDRLVGTVGTGKLEAAVSKSGGEVGAPAAVEGGVSNSVGEGSDVRFERSDGRGQVGELHGREVCAGGDGQNACRGDGEEFLHCEDFFGERVVTLEGEAYVRVAVGGFSGFPEIPGSCSDEPPTAEWKVVSDGLVSEAAGSGHARGGGQ